jgi:dGTPase
VGEEILNELYHDGFRHNEQSRRVVELLEKDGWGLNLTWEVRDGITNHSKPEEDIFGESYEKVATLEGEVCRIADAIAYINHDIGDAIRAGIITEDDLPLSAIIVLGRFHSQRINTMICDIIFNSWAATGSDATAKPTIRMSHKVAEASNELRQFLFERVYYVQSTQQEAEKARKVVRELYQYFVKHQDRLPPEYRLYSDETERSVVDYTAGMTDQYALRLAEELALAAKGRTG